MPAYSIVTERPIDGYDQFVRGEAVALASDLLDRLAAGAGVRPLLDFFSMDPGEVDALFDGLNLQLPEAGEGPGMDADGAADPADTSPLLEETPPEEWFESREGLATIRALIQALQDQPLHADGVRWHLSVDF